MPTFEDAVKLVQSWDEMNRTLVGGDWQDHATASVANYRNREGEKRDELLAYWLDCQFTIKAAWHSLEAVAIDHLLSDLPLPRQLALWLALGLKGEIKKPATGAYATLYRDHGLARMVLALCRTYEMNPYRNDATEHIASACDVVRVALNLDYKLVAAAYRKCKDDVLRDW